MMNFKFVEEERGSSDKEEEEPMTSKLVFPSPSSSSSSSQYKNFLPQHQKLWLGPLESQQDYKIQEPAINFDKKLEIMDLSLGNSSNNGTENTGAGPSGSVEKEHMFDKVVTPSDVGKLNRLVIPKQHAEKYFPLDSSSSEKGLLLNFEDRNGKPWRFRYSYWNSSQSYVMTKGWSRFVKEKKLDAGDIVSFQRGVGESGKHHLYIDWRRRPNAPTDPTSFLHLEHQNPLYFPQSAWWGSRLYSLPQSLSMPRAYEQHLDYNIQSYHNHNHQFHQPAANYNYANVAQHYFRPPIEAMRHHHQQQGGQQAPMVIDSVPIVHGKTAGKRFRLFGVNMECPMQDESSSPSITITNQHVAMDPFSAHSGSSSLPPLQTEVPSSGPAPAMQSEFSKKGKTALAFDLDL
uniref:B3 domain-containing transcription factor NGA1-like isoform X1 n=1 Tax=Rhizophora mucronata TaxID=61149 RepID=A0A2P2ISK1_RHIMU